MLLEKADFGGLCICSPPLESGLVNTAWSAHRLVVPQRVSSGDQTATTVFAVGNDPRGCCLGGNHGSVDTQRMLFPHIVRQPQIKVFAR